MNVSDFIIKRLASWGISRIYGYPGDGINGLLGALSRSVEPIKFTQVRHEEMAAHGFACTDSRSRHHALTADRPVLLEAITDPEVSPFPDHVMMRNAEHLAASVRKGDKGALQHTGHILQQKIETYL
jgi:thiamine pyrophosphate-dependent acetolactate synthase large subunit-like protein